MRRILLLAILTVQLLTMNAQQTNYPVYTGTDLGCTYHPKSTTIRVYAPTARALRLNLYRSGSGGTIADQRLFTKDEAGTWIIELQGNFKNWFYTVQAQIDNTWNSEVTDPYAKAVGVNGNRVQIIDLADTNPKRWALDRSPDFSSEQLQQDAIIYELHVRDASMHPSSGIRQKGLFNGLTELNTRNKSGQRTGLSHLRELGVTHVHLLPVFDFNSVDEAADRHSKYNWGYDPKNYNTPEGSYSSNPHDGAVRIREFKELVAAMHRAGLRVVMDVVYNHTAVSAASNFHQLVPGYYHRMIAPDRFADASACGNETASEKPMMRKFMLESLMYWAREYHIDGFRFDLMAIHDIETMNAIADSLRRIKPDMLLYGEGWAASAPALEANKMAFKRFASKLNQVAVFSDDMRDAIKGYVFEEKATGLVNGNPSMTETIKFGIAGSMPHPQVKMEKAFYDKVPYASQPGQVINYVDCHDNLILWDKLAISAPKATPANRVKMQELALALVLTGQGIPFLHAGSEFLRTKKGVENSFNKPDSINAIDWSLKEKNRSTFNWVKQLIQIRKTHPLFRLRTAAQLEKQLQFLNLPDGIIAFELSRTDEADIWKKILVVCNSLTEKATLNIPEGIWMKAASNQPLPKTVQQQLKVPSLSFSIWYQQ